MEITAKDLKSGEITSAGAVTHTHTHPLFADIACVAVCVRNRNAANHQLPGTNPTRALLWGLKHEHSDMNTSFKIRSAFCVTSVTADTVYWKQSQKGACTRVMCMMRSAVIRDTAEWKYLFSRLSCYLKLVCWVSEPSQRYGHAWFSLL